MSFRALSPQPSSSEIPARFEPAVLHPIALAAAHEVIASLRSGQIAPGVPSALLHGRGGGKMFGVLVVRDVENRIGFLRAFSAQLDGTWDVEGYAPPVFDRARRESTEPRGEAVVRKLTARVIELEASPAWSELRAEKAKLLERQANEDRELKKRLLANHQARHDGTGTAITTPRDDETEHRREKKRMRDECDLIDRELASFERRLRRLKQLRLAASRICSKQLYDSYLFTNSSGQAKTLWELCAPRGPPSGTGDCAAPKLIVYALQNKLEPLALAEFWWGRPSRGGEKTEGQFYPPCTEKCGLVLPFLLSGDPAPPRAAELLHHAS